MGSYFESSVSSVPALVLVVSSGATTSVFSYSIRYTTDISSKYAVDILMSPVLSAVYKVIDTFVVTGTHSLLPAQVIGVTPGLPSDGYFTAPFRKLSTDPK